MRSPRSLSSDSLKLFGESNAGTVFTLISAISQYYITLEMSENKPNDEPKLSTTDRVVKCKCNPSTTARHPSRLVAATNVVEDCLLAMGEEEGC